MSAAHGVNGKKLCCWVGGWLREKLPQPPFVVGEKKRKEITKNKRGKKGTFETNESVFLDEIVLNKFRANTGPFQGRKLALFYLLFPGSAPTMFKVPKTQEK